MTEIGGSNSDAGRRHVVILGAGSIGVSFAAVFADAGWRVRLIDPDRERLADASAAIAVQDEAMGTAGLRRSRGGDVAFAPVADAALAKADIVIECGPERLDLKREIFAGLLRATRADCVLATASSAIPMSRIVPDEADQRRCLVAHPVNPPAVLRLIEICPAPGTDETTACRAVEMFGSVGFHAVRLGREVEGFVLNRLQGAVLREAYRLVDEEVVDVEGIEAVMRLGLAPRWALSGPFETAELNTPGGIRAHVERMGPAYARMGAERGETVDWREDLVARVEAQRRMAVAADDLPARRSWRARSVARLVAARDRLMEQADER